MANPNDETSLDMNQLCSCSLIRAINETNPGISSLTWGWMTSTPSVCLPVSIQMQRPLPANSIHGKKKIIFLSNTFQAILALYIGSSSSPPPSLPTLLVAFFMVIGFAVSFAGVFIQNAFPRIALLFEKFSALFAAIGIYIMVGSHLVPQNLVWICWLVGAASFLAFGISFK